MFRSSLRPWLAGVAFLAVVGSAFVTLRPDADASAEGIEGIEFLAIGGTWIAAEPEFTETNGGYRIKTDFHLVKRAPAEATGPELVAALCRTFLYKLGTDASDVSVGDIYRIDMQARIPSEDGFEPLWPIRLTVPVVDGACVKADKDGVYFPRFAPPLTDWELQAFHVEFEPTTGIFSFAAVSDETGQPFPFEQACKAVLTDQAYREAVETNEAFIGVVDRMEQVKIVLRKRHFGNSSLFGFGVYKSRTFTRAGLACVSEEGDDA